MISIGYIHAVRHTHLEKATLNSTKIKSLTRTLRHDTINHNLRKARCMINVYYNHKLDILGLGLEDIGVVKIEERANYYMVLTNDWTLIGEL